MARRRNAIAHRFARMRGLPPEEKALMQRIGNLIDAALNNRQASNPFEQSQARTNRQVYPPTGLLVRTGLSSAKILWDATPSNELLRYEVDFTNLTTGLSETKNTFTNEITYKGADGTYIARVKSVGRDGSSSTIREIEFGLGSDAMLIEGAKNGPTELGTIVQDNIKLFKDYSVYAWGSCILDKYILDTNNSVVFKLWRADKADAVFGEASLVETITLYPATESGTDLDSTARAGLISRPAGTRSGSFETSQAVMFTPVGVDDDDDETTATFFLQAVNRETEQDEVCLSLVLWEGADGVGTAIPGDPYTPPAPYVFPHFNSFHRQGAPNGADQTEYPYDTRDWCANVEDNYSLIGNKWTVAMWMRFDNLAALNIADGGTVDGNDQQLLSRMTIDSRGTPYDYPNKWKAWITAVHDATANGLSHRLYFQIYDYRAGPDGGNPADSADSRTIYYSAAAYGTRLERSALFLWGDAQTDIGATYNDGWYFIVMCFEGGDFTGPIPKFRLYMNTGTNSITGEPEMALMVPSLDGSTDPVTQSDDGALAYHIDAAEDHVNYHWLNGVFNGDLAMGPWVSAGAQYYQLGIWNVALDNVGDFIVDPTIGYNIGPISSLFNEGRGWAVDWKRNTGRYAVDGPYHHLDYLQSGNLVHLNQFGAVEEWFRTKRAGRDTGWYLPDWEGELSWTFNREEQGYEWHQAFHDGSPPDHYHQRQLLNGSWYDNLPQSWHRGTDIYDILSPLGTNSTTAYNYAYPGQNMSTEGSLGDAEQEDYHEQYVRGEYVWGPYSPGYLDDATDRPITGGTG